MPRKITFELHSITFQTDGFDHLTHDNAEIKGMRLLSLPFVTSVDSTHGIIELSSSLEEIPEHIALLTKHLTARVAKGEGFTRGEWYQGFTPGGTRPIHYNPGDYPTDDFDQSRF